MSNGPVSSALHQRCVISSRMKSARRLFGSVAFASFAAFLLVSRLALQPGEALRPPLSPSLLPPPQELPPPSTPASPLQRQRMQPPLPNTTLLRVPPAPSPPALPPPEPVSSCDAWDHAAPPTAAALDPQTQWVVVSLPLIGLGDYLAGLLSAYMLAAATQRHLYIETPFRGPFVSFAPYEVPPPVGLPSIGEKGKPTWWKGTRQVFHGHGGEAGTGCFPLSLINLSAPVLINPVPRNRACAKAWLADLETLGLWQRLVPGVEPASLETRAAFVYGCVLRSLFKPLPAVTRLFPEHPSTRAYAHACCRRPPPLRRPLHKGRAERRLARLQLPELLAGVAAGDLGPCEAAARLDVAAALSHHDVPARVGRSVRTLGARHRVDWPSQHVRRASDRPAGASHDEPRLLHGRGGAARRLVCLCGLGRVCLQALLPADRDTPLELVEHGDAPQWARPVPPALRRCHSRVSRLPRDAGSGAVRARWPLRRQLQHHGSQLARTRRGPHDAPCGRRVDGRWSAVVDGQLCVRKDSGVRAARIAAVQYRCSCNESCLSPTARPA